MTSSTDPITWFTINNVVPLVASAVMIASSFFLLQTQVKLLAQKQDIDSKQQNEKMDILIAQQQRILEKYESIESRYGTLSLKVNTLETRINMR